MPPYIHHSLRACFPISLEQKVWPKYRRSDTEISRKITTDGVCIEKAKYQYTSSHVHILLSGGEEHMLQLTLRRKSKEKY